MNPSQTSHGHFLVYQAEDGRIDIDVRLEDETVWLTQQQLTELFQTSKQNTRHRVNSIIKEGELSFESTVKKYMTVRKEGNRTVQRNIDY